MRTNTMDPRQILPTKKVPTKNKVADFIFFYVSAASHHFLSPIILEEHIPFLPTFILTERDP